MVNSMNLVIFILNIPITISAALSNTDHSVENNGLESYKCEKFFDISVYSKNFGIVPTTKHQLTLYLTTGRCFYTILSMSNLYGIFFHPCISLRPPLTSHRWIL
jgi:hypothetical protein